MDKKIINGIPLKVGYCYLVWYKLNEPEIMKVTRKSNYLDLEFTAFDGSCFDLDDENISILHEITSYKDGDDYVDNEIDKLRLDSSSKIQFNSYLGDSKWINLNIQSIQSIINKLEKLKMEMLKEEVKNG